jgi:Arc/MetJ-type ribon-helix-helix transcriptional regulator
VCTKRVQEATIATVTVPVTARLDETVVEALDRAVAAGLAPNRGSLVANAVHEWLKRHGEEAITRSYQRRYGQPDAEYDALIAALSSFSVAACLANAEH